MLTLAATAIHLLTNMPVFPSRVVIIPNLQASMKVDRSSIFSERGGVSLLAAL